MHQTDELIFILFYFIFILFYFILFYFILFYFILFYFILFYKYASTAVQIQEKERYRL